MTTSKREETSGLVINIDSSKFPIVGVGASAGGLDAFKRLLENIPEQSGMAYVLVQHLDPKHESLLPEILQRATKIPVQEITDDIKLVPDNIYIMPAAKTLTVEEGVLSLKPRQRFKPNLPIDIFFQSLAEVHKEYAYGVLLSGTGSDGTLGLKAIREKGGITVAQDLQTSAYPDMPKHAIEAGIVDFILKPEEIAGELVRISKNFPKVASGEITKSSARKDETIFKEIFSLLYQRSGIDFTYYKQSTVRRRIARRMGISKKDKLKDYLDFLGSNTTEQDSLFQDMLIPVTSFFRNSESFDAVSERILPILLKDRSTNDPFRLWVAGCSTGEEAFSFAILLHEFLEKHSKKLNYTRVPIQIFASDVSEIAIKKARKGIFTQAAVENISKERLKKYFHKSSSDNYLVNQQIRDMCVFAPHNFLKDPPFSKMDLISCRNVLIYMDNFLQKKALTTFHYSLKPNGYLLLGKSESASAASGLFNTLDKHHKIYEPKDAASRFIPLTERRSKDRKPMTGQGNTKTLPEKIQTDFKKTAEAILLTEHTPAAVIVNDQLEIVHIHGRVTPFLEPSPGKPNFNLIKMARAGLGFELRNALHKAKANNETIIKEGIPIKSNGKGHLITIEIVPLLKTVEPHYLVLFKTTVSVKEGGTDESGEPLSLSKEAQNRIDQLENELADAREDMRSISEEQEVVNEELQSSNEELQSSNEEMQSLNEEMETSKEELQSSNEELIIVNQELLDKQDQLITARLYAESINDTLRHPLIILDKSLHIKTANASFYKKFNTTKEEIEGELFYDIQNNQWDHDEMRNLLEKALPKKGRLKEFELNLDFQGLGKRAILLNASQVINNPTDEKLILLAIEDVTEIRKSLQVIQASETKFKFLTQAMPHLIWTATPDGNRDFFNKYMLDYTGKTLESLKDDGWKKLIFPEDRERSVAKWQRSIDTGEEFIVENRIRDHEGKYQWHMGRAIALRDETGNISTWMGSHTNIQEQKMAEELKDEFISIASHELKTPLTSASGYIQLLLLALKEDDKEAILYGIKVSESIHRLKNLIAELLDVSKIKQGKLNYTITTFNFNHLVDDTIKDINQLSNSHKIIKIGNCQTEIAGDRDRLQQVITNLLTNAIKYSPKADEVVLSIEENDDTLKVSIRDNGIGMNKKHLDKIFDRYYRVEEHSREFQGMGIGLYISKEIIKRHDGKIWAESRVGSGTTFYFTLPL